MSFSFRTTLRGLVKDFGFTAVALTTLALGIGVNTAMVSLMTALLYQTAPFPQPRELVRVWDTSPRENRGSFSLFDLEEMRAQGTFASLTTWTWWTNSLSEPGRAAEQLTAINATADFFTTFRVQPILGRAFTAEEEAEGKNHVTLLSYDLWQRRFNGRRDIVGQVVRLNTDAVTVIGVMPASLRYPFLWGHVDLWRPISMPRFISHDRNSTPFQAIARLKPGMTPKQAEAQLAPLAARLAKDHPQTNEGHAMRVEPLHESTMGELDRSISWMLVGLSGFVLLIACANLANLQLARAIGNARDLAVRSALGASRAQLIVHQLFEAVLLALGGGCLGLLVGAWISDVLERQILIAGEPTLSLALSGRVLAIALLVTVGTAALFGILPAILATRLDMNSTLKQQSRSTTAGPGHHFLRRALIIGEIALALILLAGASVMSRGFSHYTNAHHGWDEEHLVTATIHPPEENRYSTPEKRRELHQKLEARLAQIPGAESIGLTTCLPIFNYTSTRVFEVDGQPAGTNAQKPTAGYTMVSPNCFATLQIPFLDGRGFSADLKPDAPPVVIINQTMARHFWPNESAVGKRIGRLDNGKMLWEEIIGVVGDVQFAGNISDPDSRFQVYRSLVQEPWGYMTLLVRASQPAALRRELARAVADVDGDIAIEKVGTVTEQLEEANHNLVLINQTLNSFAALGVVLAAVGLYGVISNLVAQRSGEFGIRLALGAPPSHVAKIVLGSGIQMAIIGMVLGAAGAYGLVRFIAHFMPRLHTADAVGFLFVAAALYTVTLVASWIPARRATRTDPLTALRAE